MRRLNKLTTEQLRAALLDGSVSVEEETVRTVILEAVVTFDDLDYLGHALDGMPGYAVDELLSDEARKALNIRETYPFEAELHPGPTGNHDAARIRFAADRTSVRRMMRP